jgi:hypothetical protein
MEEDTVPEARQFQISHVTAACWAVAFDNPSHQSWTKWKPSKCPLLVM